MELGLVKVEKVRLVKKESAVKAFCDILIAGIYVVKGLRVILGSKGLFVGFPREKGKDDKYYDTFYPITNETRLELVDVIIKAYEKAVKEENNG